MFKSTEVVSRIGGKTLLLTNLSGHNLVFGLVEASNKPAIGNMEAADRPSLENVQPIIKAVVKRSRVYCPLVQMEGLQKAEKICFLFAQLSTIFVNLLSRPLLFTYKL